MKEPLVSVVTPVFNGEDYLAECIESVLGQSYTNWEYTIVNNCSTDASFEIATRYAGLDSRIRVVNNPVFLNQIQNLNNSLRQISSESKYCKMVLADDWIFPNCLSEMVKVAEMDSGIGLVSAYRLIENEVHSDGLPYDQSIFSGNNIGRNYLLYRHNHFGSQSSVLFRSDLVRREHSFFNEDEVHADTSVFLKIVSESKFGFVHQVLSFSRRSNLEKSTSSFAHYYDTYSLSYLDFMIKYGSRFLNPEEHTREYKKLLYRHYRKMIGYLFRLKGVNVLSYHLSEMKNMGIKHRIGLIFKAVLVETLLIFSNLKKMAIAAGLMIRNERHSKSGTIEFYKNNTSVSSLDSSKERKRERAVSESFS
ncbi:MAG: glycosyltransferase family 2 protein [Cyclonatronaceae bacterium]